MQSIWNSKKSFNCIDQTELCAGWDSKSDWNWIFNEQPMRVTQFWLSFHFTYWMQLINFFHVLFNDTKKDWKHEKIENAWSFQWQLSHSKNTWLIHSFIAWFVVNIQVFLELVHWSILFYIFYIVVLVIIKTNKLQECNLVVYYTGGT